jgi:prepilin-type N-terminal cleavage/methylation domain-containing protein
MKKGFTLIELLIVIAIVAILAVVVVLTINPAELLRQGRDVTRISDMGTLNKAVSLYYQDAMSSPSTMFMGTSSVIYVSVPDPTATSTAGNQCTGLGLPTPPTGYTYQCAASSTYMKTNGTGWIPINFNSYSAGAVISKLPTDPVNTTSTNLYYTYETDGIGGFKVAAFFESQKDAPQMASDSGNDPELYEKGSNLALASGRGLVGYWPMDEGMGTTAKDLSGNGNNGTYTLGSWTKGKVGPYAASVGSSSYTQTSYVSFGTPLPSSSFTLSFWANPNGFNAGGMWGNAIFGSENYLTNGFRSALDSTGFYFWTTQSGGTLSVQGGTAVVGRWDLWTITYTTGTASLYQNGILRVTAAGTYIQNLSNIGLDSGIGGMPWSWGNVDEVRVYNRALSATEIQEMYNAEK